LKIKLLLWSVNSCGEQAIFKLDIKKKSGLSLNPDIHHSKVFSSDIIGVNCNVVDGKCHV